MSTTKFYEQQPREQIGSFDKLKVLIIQFNELGEVNLLRRSILKKRSKMKTRHDLEILQQLDLRENQKNDFGC